LKVSVRLFTTLRELAEGGEEALEFATRSITVHEVLETLAKRHGRAFRDYLYDDKNRVREHLQLLVNGKSVNLLDNLETRLREGDTLAIVPPIGGG
jgi:molybdopterin synthase sulfur carrier subunit